MNYAKAFQRLADGRAERKPAGHLRAPQVLTPKDVTAFLGSFLNDEGDGLQGRATHRSPNSGADHDAQTTTNPISLLFQNKKIEEIRQGR